MRRWSPARLTAHERFLARSRNPRRTACVAGPPVRATACVAVNRSVRNELLGGWLCQIAKYRVIRAPSREIRWERCYSTVTAGAAGGLAKAVVATPIETIRTRPNPNPMRTSRRTALGLTDSMHTSHAECVPRAPRREKRMGCATSVPTGASSRRSVKPGPWHTGRGASPGWRGDSGDRRVRYSALQRREERRRSV